ncbi:hypothetical protein FJZ31_22625 [Candidatus Poribacteria bacterium]|nr:hypothetical protein [Candidatus Poribacteria bacterium]
MNRLIVELPEYAYKQLVKRAEKQQKLPEQLVVEKLIAEFGIAVRSKSQAKRIAKDFLASCIGEALVPQIPSFDRKRAVWQVPIAIELLASSPLVGKGPGKRLTEVGTLEIDAKTGCVLTESPSFSALWKQFRALLGIEDFPTEKQSRLSELLDLGNQGELTESLQAELKALFAESEAQETANLQRLSERLPARRKK